MRAKTGSCYSTPITKEDTGSYGGFNPIPQLTVKMAKRKQLKSKKAQKSAQGRPRTGLADARVAAYLNLLSNPCTGRLVPAPYVGVGSSYMVRTVNNLPLYFGATLPAGTKGKVDFAVDFTPWNCPAALTYAVGSAGVTMPNSYSGHTLSNFVTMTDVVKSYRPIASCFKFVPTGAIADRSGVIGLAYSPNKMMATNVPYKATDLLGSCQRRDATGSVEHEVTWLPSFMDERFGTNGETNMNGCGTCHIVGKDVDAVADGTNVNVSGYLEMTVVWEWEPADPISTGRYNGTVPSMSTPSPVPLNTVLSYLGDIGNFALKHAVPAVGRAAYAYAVGTSLRRGHAMLTY